MSRFTTAGTTSITATVAHAVLCPADGLAKGAVLTLPGVAAASRHVHNWTSHSAAKLYVVGGMDPHMAESWGHQSVDVLGMGLYALAIGYSAWQCGKAISEYRQRRNADA